MKLFEGFSERLAESRLSGTHLSPGFSRRKQEIPPAKQFALMGYIEPLIFKPADNRNLRVFPGECRAENIFLPDAAVRYICRRSDRKFRFMAKAVGSFPRSSASF